MDTWTTLCTERQKGDWYLIFWKKNEINIYEIIQKTTVAHTYATKACLRELEWVWIYAIREWSWPKSLPLHEGNVLNSETQLRSPVNSNNSDGLRPTKSCQLDWVELRNGFEQFMPVDLVWTDVRIDFPPKQIRIQIFIVFHLTDRKQMTIPFCAQYRNNR